MEPESSYIEEYVSLLVTGYARKLSETIPTIVIYHNNDDIVKLILMFFSSYYDILHTNLINILYRKCWNSFNFRQGRRNCNWNYISNYESIHINLRKNIIAWSSIQYQTYPIPLDILPINISNLTTLRHDKWSMFIRSCTCNLRPRGEIYLNVMDKITNDTNPYPRKSYGWKLPNAISTGDCTIYNQTQNILYDITLFNKNNTNKHGIFALDFNDNHGYDNWKWKLLKGQYLKYPRVATGCCMVDNDRFIAVLGGAHLNGHTAGNGNGGGGGGGGNGQQQQHIFYKEFELFALNCHKVIQLKSMLNRRLKPVTIYHPKFHKIIVGGGGNIFGGGMEEMVKGIEVYDINKDKWYQETVIGLMTVGNVGMYEMKISDINPNIIYMTLSNDGRSLKSNRYNNYHKNGYNHHQNNNYPKYEDNGVHVLRMDLRENNMHKMFPVVWQYEQ